MSTLKYLDVELSILAGGKSSRMGSHKGNLKINNKDFVTHIVNEIGDMFSAINVIDNGQQKTKLSHVNYYHDKINLPKKSGLLGLHSALHYTKSKYCFIISCDTPLVNRQIINIICQNKNKADAVIPELDKINPLYGLYRKKPALSLAEDILQGSDHWLMKMLKVLPTYYINQEKLKKIDPNLSFGSNINTPNDYEKWVKTKTPPKN
ncbi:molybdenum cofactor guanylyltransferase [Proteinivorax tanatarense]|uniref:Molybdenum cofactor guanylyltransferase n=1 Tax=Proteinivorax tanatarense TaxID=1260629 RepID=A0AAU7VMX3_9FIRM